MKQISALEKTERVQNNLYIYRFCDKAGTLVKWAHWHDEFEILFVPSDGATCKVCMNTETLIVEKGSFMFINSEQMHSAAFHSDGEYYAILFNLGFLDFKNSDFCQTEIIDALKNKTYTFPHFADIEPSLRQRIWTVLQDTVAFYFSGVAGRELKMKCNLYEIIFLLYTNKSFIVHKDHHYNSVQLSYVKSAISFMEKNHAVPVQIDDLAKFLNLNKYYLIKIFKRITGETPIIFLRNLRLNVSKHHLAKGLSVTETALASGFNNVSYYIRHFKKKNNVSPKKYHDG